MRSVLLATCAAFPDGDEDGPELIAALQAVGIEARFAVWDDRSVDWSAAPVVLRSTWDYTLHRAAFMDWVRSVPVLHNRADLVLWSSDKLYLRDLQAAGVPITPTTVIAPGTTAPFPAVEFVVKPSVGAGSRGAGRFTSADDALGHIAVLHAAGRTALVQPYVHEVDEAGETALVYLGGAFSHAVRKGPMLSRGTVHDLAETAGLFVEENITPRTPSAAELAVGSAALASLTDRFGQAPLYARVDLLPFGSGPVVVELEVVEPSLFLSGADGAAHRFATAIAART